MAAKRARSRKRSATRAESLLEESTFFIDSCLGRSLKQRLLAKGHKVIHHDERFSEGTDDKDWIPVVAAHGYIILTKDKAIRRDSDEMMAVISSKAILLTFPKGSYTPDEMEAIFTLNRLDIGRLLKKTSAPLIASISRNGVALRYPH